MREFVVQFHGRLPVSPEDAKTAVQFRLNPMARSGNADGERLKSALIDDIIVRMKLHELELPTQEGVRKACEQFDDENKIAESALTDLFARYPNNTSEAEVLLKVVTLNDLYSTQIPTYAPHRPNVFDIARFIPKLGLDQAFTQSSLDIVDTISTTKITGKKQIYRFSFATKYASWHKKDIYPIWDGNVQNYLTCLRKLYRAEWDKFADGFDLSSNEWGYPEFHGLIVRFRAHFRLAEVSFKDLDKFLWQHGR